MTCPLSDEPQPVLTLQSRIGWQIYYSEIIFDDPPCLFMQALPDFPGGNKPEAGQDVVWDVFSLIDSIKRPGAYQMLTCTCGYAPDAGLEGSILVSYPDTGTIAWELDIPGLRPALDKSLTGDREGYVRLVFARERYEADIRELVRALQQAGHDPVPVTALDSRTYGLKHLLTDYPACDSLPVDELEPNTGGGMALERMLKLNADEPWPSTPLWPAGTPIEFGFFPGKSGHELMRVNGDFSDCHWPGYYFTRWEVLAAFNIWLSYVHRAYALKSTIPFSAATVSLRKDAAPQKDRKSQAGIKQNEFVLLHAAGRQQCHDAGRRFTAIFQASLQEGETVPGVTVRYCENFLHAADDEPFPAEDDAGH